MRTYICKTCGDHSKWSHQKTNVFCSNRCASEGKLAESIKRLKAGKLKERATIRKALSSLFGYHCNQCNISEWQDAPITLHVDHKDGDASNNELSNLQLICPNCHSQTSTFGGRNKGKGRKARGLSLK